jgi:hypothetical protein
MTANELKHLTPNPTGELTLGQRAAARREAAQPGYAERLAAHQAAWEAAPTETRPEWSTEPVRHRLELAHIEERMAATDAAIAELLAE